MKIEVHGRQYKTIIVDDYTVTIVRRGGAWGSERKKVIPISNITGVEVKKPGAFFAGFIQIQTAGMSSSDSTYTVSGGTFSAVQDENSVVFAGAFNYENAIKIQRHIALHNSGVGQQSTQSQKTASGNSMYCKYCGKEIPKDSVFCKHCGKNVLDAKKEPVQEKKQAPQQPKPSKSPKAEHKEYDPKAKIKMDDAMFFKTRQKKQHDSNADSNNSVSQWIVGFRSKNALCMVLAVIWYLCAIYAAIDGNWAAFFGMIAIAYLAMGIIKYKQYQNSLYIILIGALCFLGSAIVTTLQPPSADETPVVAQATNVPATAEPMLTPEQADAEYEQAKQDLQESWNELKEAVGIDTEEKPEDRPFDPSEYSSAPSYEELARYPDNYTDGMYKFYGEAIQVSEGIFNTAIRLKINDDIDQVIYCEVPNDMLESRRILENDFVTMYGVYKGTTTYTTVLGARLTVPKIRVTQWMM